MSAVHAAYQKAITEPTRQNFVNGALMYDYEPNKLYTLHTSPRFLTAIALRPGEKLVSKAAGDTVRWVMDETEGVTNAVGQSQTIVIIKPIEGGLRTNVVLTTDQRVYLLEAVSHAEPYYTSMISWNYPADQAREAQLAKAVSTVKAMAATANVVAPGVAVSHLDFDYSITSKGAGGGLFHSTSAAPRWTPVRVFDDGSKTYIQFPHDLATTEAPPLFLIGPHDSVELVNYRFAGGYYVVDRLITVAELRLGDKPQSVVRIAFDGTRSRTQ
ncbi:MAG: TrbG/VirB9 family P-type conjugative transfer protein [Caulobacteraceae bacterium]